MTLNARTEAVAPPPIDGSPMPEHAQADAAGTRWTLATRVAFRFCFAYFGLFCVGYSQILDAMQGILGGLLPEPAVRWIELLPLREWVAAQVFHLDTTSLHVPTGSGDTAFDWVSLACWLVLAVVVTVIWSVLDRRRPNHGALHKWFCVFVRFALAGQMISYGFAKAIPLQMPFPSLARLVQPFGTFSPMGVLWSQVGSSPPYEIALGCVEILAGLLLILPRTATLGALVSTAATAQIFLLNMTFDVPVKILSSHLLLLSLVLVAPQAERLAKVFLSGEPVGPPRQPQLFRTRRANRTALIAQVVLGLSILVTQFGSDWVAYHDYGGGREKSPLYGIWNVAEFTSDGQVHPPLLTDKTRFRRVIFDAAGAAEIQTMDDSIGYFAATVDTERHVVELADPADGTPMATFTFARNAGTLVLDAELSGHRVHMVLEPVNVDTFTLVNRGFHWVQEFPYNR